MSMFDRGEAMSERMFAIGAVPVSYRRAGAVLASDIPAKLGKTLFRAENNFGITIRDEQRDFIVRRSELDIDPENGDEILFKGKVYLVTAPNHELCWRWHTRQSHSQMRIHAKYAGDDK